MELFTCLFCFRKFGKNGLRMGDTGFRFMIWYDIFNCNWVNSRWQ